MSLTVDLNDCVSSKNAPKLTQFTHWVKSALAAADYLKPAEVSLSIVSEEDIQALNLQYREKDKPTNVLSFPAELHPSVDIPLLGDIIFCETVLNKEAQEQGKQMDAHWAHLTIHGTLHLLGYDHIDDSDALLMENLEINTLKALGYPNPYI